MADRWVCARMYECKAGKNLTWRMVDTHRFNADYVKPCPTTMQCGGGEEEWDDRMEFGKRVEERLFGVKIVPLSGGLTKTKAPQSATKLEPMVDRLRVLFGLKTDQTASGFGSFPDGTSSIAVGPFPAGSSVECKTTKEDEFGISKYEEQCAKHLAGNSIGSCICFIFTPARTRISSFALVHFTPIPRGYVSFMKEFEDAKRSRDGYISNVDHYLWRFDEATGEDVIGHPEALDHAIVQSFYKRGMHVSFSKGCIFFVDDMEGFDDVRNRWNRCDQDNWAELTRRYNRAIFGAFSENTNDPFEMEIRIYYDVMDTMFGGNDEWRRIVRQPRGPLTRRLIADDSRIFSRISSRIVHVK